MIEHVSRGEMIYPGDLFGSGTVGGGCGLELDRYLKPGDVVELEIQPIGVLRTQVIARAHEGAPIWSHRLSRKLLCRNFRNWWSDTGSCTKGRRSMRSFESYAGKVRRAELSVWDIHRLLRTSRSVYFDTHVEVVSGHHTATYVRFESIARFPQLVTPLHAIWRSGSSELFTTTRLQGLWRHRPMPGY